MDRTLRVLLLVALATALLAGLAGTASAGSQRAPTFAPYLVPPQVPPPASPAIAALLRGSSVTGHDGWIVAHLTGGPYRVGFQNGYLTAQSADYGIQYDVGPLGSQYRKVCAKVAQNYIWPLVPAEYQQELQGIADGMHAAGYAQDTLWDVVAANAWADEPCYAQLLPNTSSTTPAPATIRATRKPGGCSAFIATGDATVDGRPVMGHDTWDYYDGCFSYNVMFYVHPTKGYALSYQSCGGQIWSGEDWYENSAGLLLSETTLADTTYTPTGIPVFVRAREAAQYASTVTQAVNTLVAGNNGAYSNEWLIGDSTGTVASLQLGGKVYDLNQTRNGFFGSCNFDWGPKTRAEEGKTADPFKPAVVDYARFIRWGQLKDQYYGRIDAQVGMTMESDTYDTYLGMDFPDARGLCGEPENFTPGLLNWDSWVLEPEGATDGKVTTESMALHGLASWACQGHPSGDHFDADAYLAATPGWASSHGAFSVFELKTFSAQATDRWVPLADK
jgi:hypothetical protein